MQNGQRDKVVIHETNTAVMQINTDSSHTLVHTHSYNEKSRPLLEQDIIAVQ